MSDIDTSLTVWLNVTTLLVFVGVLFWISLWPYMTKGDE
jgi:uncharacterized membrane protein